MGFIWNGNNNQVLEIEVTYADHVRSIPPSGMCKVTNVYVDPQNEKLKAEWDDEPAE